MIRATTLFLAMLFLGNIALTQNLKLQFGTNLSNCYEYMGDLQNVSSDNQIFGIKIALLYDYPIIEYVALESGLMYNCLGFKDGRNIDYADLENALELDFLFRLYYINVPLHLHLNLPLSENISLIASAGPYIGYMLANNSKQTRLNIVRNLEYGTKINQLKHLDYGFDFGGGIKYKKVELFASFQYGTYDFANIPEHEIYNRVLSFGLIIFN